MEKFKVKKKHLTGEIADFPKRVVQAMVDEQVRQGNPADPSVFSVKCVAGKSQGGFNWHESTLGHDSWVKIMLWKHFHLIPKREKPRCPDSAPRTEATPHEIIQHVLDSAYDAGYSLGYDDGYRNGKSSLEGDINNAYEKGYTLGYEDGYGRGYSEGHSEVKTLLKMR